VGGGKEKGFHTKRDGRRSHNQKAIVHLMAGRLDLFYPRQTTRRQSMYPMHRT
jgi:hypothetical protein